MPVLAQEEADTLKLPEFEIRSNFNLDNQGFKRVKLDSIVFIPNQSADLGTIISEHTTIFIKSYGNGTLATPSFRGTSAQHTQVEWNGISLNSPMLGQMDFSQVPVAQFDGLEILYGAAGISRTSGAFGGVIDLVTGPDWSNRFRFMASQQIGSFGLLGTNVNAAIGNPGFQADLKFNYTTAVNDFPYTNPKGETVTQQNASYSQGGISQEMFWKVRDKHLFSTKIWYSQDDRKLPPTDQTLDSLKRETLNDKAFRAVAEYKFIAQGWNMVVRSAINDQHMEYYNSSPEINSSHHSFSWINRVRFSYSRIRKLTIKPGVDFSIDHVVSTDYELGSATRNTASLFADIAYEIHPKVKASLVLREDIIDGKPGKLVPAVGMEYVPFRKINLAFTSNLSRNYRYPTLNDISWKNSGTPDLKPELNYCVEGGSTFNQRFFQGKFYLEASLTGYYSWIYDMIIWTPDTEGSGLFKPENIDEIHARGVEAGLNFEGVLGSIKIGMKNNYNFCRSTYESVSSATDQKLGKQQIYIPVHTLNSTISLEKWKFYLHYNLYFVSDRYTGKDNAEIMPGYSISNLIFGRNIDIRHFLLSLQFDLNNLFNLDYQSIESRPMPGRNFLFTIKLSYPGSQR